MNKPQTRRIGIFAGSFDPIHKGHIGFALSALEVADLDEIYLVPEARPRHKPGVTHIGHRTAMLKLAVRPYRHIHVLELPDKRFSVTATLPRLQTKFPDAELLLLIGSDVLMHLAQWPRVDELLNKMGLIVSVRSGAEITAAMDVATNLPRVLKELYILESLEPSVSSRQIRSVLRRGHKTKDVVGSVQKYADKHWLYASVSDSTA